MDVKQRVRDLEQREQDNIQLMGSVTPVMATALGEATVKIREELATLRPRLAALLEEEARVNTPKPTPPVPLRWQDAAQKAAAATLVGEFVEPGALSEAQRREVEKAVAHADFLVRFRLKRGAGFVGEQAAIPVAVPILADRPSDDRNGLRWMEARTLFVPLDVAREIAETLEDELGHRAFVVKREAEQREAAWGASPPLVRAALLTAKALPAKSEVRAALVTLARNFADHAGAAPDLDEELQAIALRFVLRPMSEQVVPSLANAQNFGKTVTR